MEFVVTLDGNGQIAADGRLLAFRTQKANELVYFLAVHGGALRTEIGRQLWPELEMDRRSANLRLTLSYLRSSAAGMIVVEGKSLRLNAEVIATPEKQILEGMSSAWAVSAREVHFRASTQKFLLEAQENGDLDIAFRARESDPYLQATRVLIAKLWMDRGEPAKAAAELRDYAGLVRQNLGIDVSQELFTQVGLPLSTQPVGSAQVFEALSPREQGLAVLGQCPSWLASGRIFHARMRLEQTIALQKSKTILCDLYRWRSRFESEAGDFSVALESGVQAMELSSSAQEKLGAEMVQLRAKLFLMRLDEVAGRVRELRSVKMSEELRADLLIAGAMAQYYLNHPVEAVELSAESLRAAERAHSQFRVVAALGMMGSSHFLAGDMASASDYAGRAAEVAGRYGMRAREANAWGLKGRSEEARGNLAAAETFYLKAVEMVTATDSLHIYGVLVTYLGDLLVKQGRAKAGLEWLKKGALARRHSSDLVGQSTSNRCLARGYLALGELSQAERSGRRAFELSVSAARDLEVAMNEVVLAEVEFARGRKHDGVALLQKALPVVRREHREGRSSTAEDMIYDPDRIAGTIARFS